MAPYLGYDAPTVKKNSGGWVSVNLKRIIGLSMLNYLNLKMLNDLPVLFFNRPAKYENRFQLAYYSYRMMRNFGTENYSKDISQISIPCLVLVGKMDESFIIDKFDEVFNSNKRYIKVKILENENHLSIVKSDNTNEEIRNFIKV